jgi:hypothetical protein
MGGPDEAQFARAKRLLAHEGASSGSSEDCALAAGRVYEKLNARLGPLLGAAGVRALFARSAKLASRDRSAVAGVGLLESSTTLSAFLQALEPAVAHEAAEALFGTFLSLTTTFIGERLTLQALRSAWPTIEEPGSKGEQE